MGAICIVSILANMLCFYSANEYPRRGLQTQTFLILLTPAQLAPLTQSKGFASAEATLARKTAVTMDVLPETRKRMIPLWETRPSNRPPTNTL